MGVLAVLLNDQILATGPKYVRGNCPLCHLPRAPRPEEQREVTFVVVVDVRLRTLLGGGTAPPPPKKMFFTSPSPQKIQIIQNMNYGILIHNKIKNELFDCFRFLKNNTFEFVEMCCCVLGVQIAVLALPQVQIQLYKHFIPQTSVALGVLAALLEDSICEKGQTLGAGTGLCVLPWSPGGLHPPPPTTTDYHRPSKTHHHLRSPTTTTYHLSLPLISI